MSDIVISAENLSKKYRLGVIGTGTFKDDLKIWFARARGKPNPLARVDELDRGNREGEDIWALRDINFEVRRGEALGIIGRNGAGKSTLLKILSRVTAPTTGNVKVKGRIASLLEVGTGFHPELTGRENIYLNGAIMGMDRSEVSRKLDEIIDFSGVEKYIDTPVKRYSSGMYVRLAFAVAAYLDPEILVVDEVLAVGDAEFQKKCLGKMGEVTGEGRTVLFVSHNMGAIEQLCSNCMLIAKGQVKEFSNDVRGVINNYLKTSRDDLKSGVWINNGSEYDHPNFQPISFKVVDENNVEVNHSIPNNSPAWIQIEASIKQYDPALTFGYALYSENNQLLFWSYQTDMEEKEWPISQPGKWCYRSKIPMHFLNEGIYRVELLASLHYREWILRPNRDIPNIWFTIQGGLSESPLWIGKRPGILAPVNKWYAEAI